MIITIIFIILGTLYYFLKSKTLICLILFSLYAIIKILKILFDIELSSPQDIIPQFDRQCFGRN